MLKRFILWDYKRGSWQYDVIVGLILAFIFLTPRGMFGDRPRMPKASGIAILRSDHAEIICYVEAGLLSQTPDSERITRLTELLRTRMSDPRLSVTRFEPILDSEGELQGYMAFAKP
jgi:hypothetical protein